MPQAPQVGLTSRPSALTRPLHRDDATFTTSRSYLTTISYPDRSSEISTPQCPQDDVTARSSVHPDPIVPQICQRHRHRKSILRYDHQSTLTRSFHTDDATVTASRPYPTIISHPDRSSEIPTPRPHKSMVPRDHQSTLAQSFRRDVDATDTASRS